MKISNIWYKNSQVLWRLKWVFTLLLPEVYSENWITPLWRETEERGESGKGKKKKKKGRQRDGEKTETERKIESLLCLARLAICKYSLAPRRANIRTINLGRARLVPEQELQYGVLPWQRLNQLMMRGMAWLPCTRSPRPGCQVAWGKALRALTGLFLFPLVYCTLIRPTAKLGFMKDRRARAGLLCPVWSDLCKSVWAVWSGSDL